MMADETHADDKAGRVIRDRIARAKAMAGYFPRFNRDDINIHSLADLTARMAHDAKVLEALVGEALATADTFLPAPALTEQVIVDALKADPGMAGRVIGELVKTLGDNGRQRLANAARDTVDGANISLSYFRGLQSLAVALAAASYRG